MRFLMLVMSDAEGEPYDARHDTIGAWVDEMTDRSIAVDGDRLRPSTEATTVRMRGGELVVTAGAPAESTAQIVGFDILECRDADEAIEVASKHPMARFGRLELRASWPLELDETGRPV